MLTVAQFEQNNRNVLETKLGSWGHAVQKRLRANFTPTILFIPPRPLVKKRALEASQKRIKAFCLKMSILANVLAKLLIRNLFLFCTSNDIMIGWVWTFQPKILCRMVVACHFVVSKCSLFIKSLTFMSCFAFSALSARWNCCGCCLHHCRRR